MLLLTYRNKGRIKRA